MSQNTDSTKVRSAKNAAKARSEHESQPMHQTAESCVVESNATNDNVTEDESRDDEAVARVFDEAGAERAFSGGVVWLAHGERLLMHRAFGSTAYEAGVSRPVATDTIYDIASLSKLFTATAVLIAAREAGVDLEEPVARFLPDFRSTEQPAIENITVRQLLDHSGGIEIAIQSFTPRPTIEGAAARLHQGVVPVEGWVERIAQAPLHAPPGQQVLYSCTNYFLLGRLVETWSQTALDRFIGERLIVPLGMTRTGFRPLRRFAREEIAPAEIDAATGHLWHGVVHDEAARAWEAAHGEREPASAESGDGTGDGACGNAGVFSTAEDLSRFARLWLDEGTCDGQQIIAAEDVRRAWTRSVRADGYDQGLGWWLNVSSWMSLNAPSGTAGHTGFTGPTMFITPGTRHVCIVLENRVHPTRNGPPRLRFHRHIAEWLFEQAPLSA